MNWYIEGNVTGEDPNGCVVAVLVDGKEYSRTVSGKSAHGDGKFYFELTSPSSPHHKYDAMYDRQWIRDLPLGQIRHVDQDAYTPSYDIIAISSEQEDANPNIINGKLGLDGERNLKVKIPNNPNATESLDTPMVLVERILKIISKLFLVTLAFTVTFSLVRFYAPEFLPNDRNDKGTKLISTICAVAIGSIFAIFLLTSESADRFTAAITDGAGIAFTTAITILFICISSFLFWRKVRAFFK